MDFLRMLHSQQSDQVALDLLTIESDQLPAAIRLVDNVESVESRGNMYYPFPFQLTPPGDLQNDTSAIVNLVMAAVYDPNDPIYGGTVALANSITSGTATLEMCLSETPDVVEYGPFVWNLRKASYNATQISFELGFDYSLDQLTPGHLITPSLFPGSFSL